MQQPRVVSATEWMAEHQRMLAKEKGFTRARDALSADRRRMPWMAVSDRYEFDGPEGRVSLSELFAGRRQLLVYRAFFDAGVHGWPDNGCIGCSLMADHVGNLAHLNARDTTLAYVSRGSQADIARIRARMGWNMPWHSMIPTPNRPSTSTSACTSGMAPMPSSATTAAASSVRTSSTTEVTRPSSTRGTSST